MRRRILLLSSIALVFFFLMFGVYAATNPKANFTGQITYKAPSYWTAKLNEDQNGLIVTKYSGYETDIEIPQELKIAQLKNKADFDASLQDQSFDVVGLEGTSTSNPVFSSTLTNITFPSTITSIGQYSFYNCTNLNNFTLPTNLTAIGQRAFYNCSNLTTLTIPANVTDIGTYAFGNLFSLGELNYNAVTANDLSHTSNSFYEIGKNADELSINIANTVTYIPAYLFSYSCATSLSLGSGVQTIGEYAFYNCKNLTTLTIPDNITSIQTCAFSGTSSLQKIYYNASQLVVTSSSMFPFSSAGASTGLQAIIGNNVVNLPDYLFYYNSALSSVTFGNSVENIGNYTFASCKNFATVEIPDAVKTIGEYAFSNSSNGIKRLTLGKSITTIGKNAFSGNPLLENIYYNATEMQDLQSSNDVFYQSGKSGDGITLTIGSSVKRIPAYLFQPLANKDYAPKITSVVFEEGPQEIATYAFAYNPYIETVTLADSVTTIAEYAFYENSGLKQLTIGQNLINLGKFSFYNTTALETINFNSTNMTDLTSSNYVFAFAGQSGDGITVNFGDNVTKVPANLFYSPVNDASYLAKITTLNLNKVQTIGQSAFYNCLSLTTLTIPENVTKISNNAFRSTVALSKIYFNATNITSYSDAFSNAGTSGNGITVFFGDNVTKIPSSLFSSTGSTAPKITDVVIGNSVANIGSYAFKNCQSITDVYYHGTEEHKTTTLTTIGSNNTYLTDAQWWYYNTETTTQIPGYYWYYDANGDIKTFVVEIRDWEAELNQNQDGLIITKYNGTSTTVEIPSKLKIADLNNIADFDFSIYNTEYSVVGLKGSSTNTAVFDNTLANITIPTTITSIGEYSFYNCSNLNNFTLPSSLNSIGSYAFYNNSKITTLTIPTGVTSIGENAFNNCTSLSTLIIGESVTSLGTYAFYNTTALTQINFNAINCTDLSAGNCVFACAGQSGDGITVNFGDNVTKVPSYIFYPRYSENMEYSPKIISAVIGNNVLSIGNYAFSNCSNLTNLTIGNSVETIEGSAFTYCTSLTEVTIPDNVTTVKMYAFQYCFGLKTLTIGTGLKTVEGTAFSYTTGLETVNFNATNMNELTTGTLAGLFAYAGSLGNGITVNIGNNVTKVPACLFHPGLLALDNPDTSCFPKVASIIIGDSVTTIGDRAFFIQSSTLKTLTIGKSVTTIGTYAFYDVTALEILNFNATSMANLTSDNEAFKSAGRIGNGLTVTIGDNVTNIPAYLFGDNGSITSLTIGESVKTIGDSAFGGCLDAPSIIIPDSVTSIGSYAFAGYSAPSLSISKNVTSLGEGAFYNAAALKTLFYDISSLTLSSNNYIFYRAGQAGNGIDVTFGNNVTRIPEYLFHPYQTEDIPKIVSLTIGNNVVDIGKNAFFNSKHIEKINFNATKMYNFIESDEVFWNAGVSGNGILVTFGDNVEKIPAYLFYSEWDSPKVREVVIGNSISTIGKYAFEYCLIKNVYYHGTEELKTEKLSNISLDAQWWYYNEDTTTVFPGNYWYYDENYNIVTFTVEGVPYTAKLNSTSDGLIITKYTGNDTQVTIPSELKIQLLGNYKSFDSSLYEQTLPVVGLEGIDTSNPVFANTLTNITFPDSITSIGQYSFYNCSNLNNFTLPANFTTIGQYAFYGNSTITTLTIPESVTTISNYAFRNTTALETINFNARNCTDLSSSNYVFYNSGQSGKGITVTFGDNVTRVPAYLFCPYSNSSYSPKITTLNLNKVQEIGDYAFARCLSLTTLTIPESVTTIGTYAFYRCTGMTTLTVGEGVLNIGTHAFDYTTAITQINFNAVNMNNLSPGNYVFSNTGVSGSGITVNFGDDVKNVPAYLFNPIDSVSYKPKIKIVNFNNVENIGQYSFRGNLNLNKITITENIKTIGTSAFYQCYRLIEVTNLSSHITGLTLGGNNNGYLTQYAKHIRTSTSDPTYLSTVGEYTWYQDDTKQEYYLIDYSTSETNPTLPNQTPSGKNYALRATFAESKITGIVIPDTVTEIDDYAFYNCQSLKSIEMGDNITRIGYYALYSCNKITTIDLSENLLVIEAHAFNGCNSLTDLTIPYKVTTLEREAFRNCTGLLSLTIGNSVTEIGTQTFFNCSKLEYVVLGRAVQVIQSSAFDSCSLLTNVYYHDTEQHKNTTLTTIGLNNAPLTNAKWWYYNEDTACEELGNYWYYDGDRNIVTFTVTNVPYTAKLNDTSDGLIITKYNGSKTDVTIPSSIKISTLANASDFDASLQDTTLNVVGLESASTSSGVFSNALTNITFPSTITSIGQYSFYNCRNLNNFTLPTNLTTIGQYAFYGNSTITSLTIPENVTSIGTYAFYNTTALEEISFNATNMNDLEVSNAVFSYAGHSGDGIVVTIGNNVTKIPSYLFYPSSSTEPKIVLLTIGENVESIGNYSFFGCNEITTLTIPNSVKSLGERSFSDLSNLKTLTMGANITSIGDWSFINTKLLTEINYNIVSMDDLSSSNQVFAYAGHSDAGITLKIDDNVEKIPGNLFNPFFNSSYSPKIISVVVGNSVASIGNYAFGYCQSIQNVYYHGTETQKNNTLTTIGSNNTYLTDAQWWYYNTNTEELELGNYWYYDANRDIKTFVIEAKYWQAKLDENGTGLIITKYTGTQTTVEIPSKIEPSLLENYVDFDIQILYTEFPIIGIEGDSTTGQSIFESVQDTVTSITIPESIQYLSNNAFLNTTALTQINFNAINMNDLDYMRVVFANAGLSGDGIVVNVGNDVQKIPAYMFYIPNTSIIANIKEVNLGNVTSVGNYAFNSCSNLSSINFGTGQLNIGDYAFNGISIENLIIPDNVVSLGNYAFSNNSNLKSVTIGKNVTTITNNPFKNCENLATITVDDNNTYFTDANSNCIIDKNSQSATFQTLLAGSNSTIIPTDANLVTTIGTYAFYGCSNLISITIPESVTSLGDFAFYETTALETINFNAINCADLSSGNNVFCCAGQSGDGITVTFGDNVTKVPEYMFHPYISSSAPKITSVVLGNSIASIGNNAFNYCTTLANVYYHGTEAEKTATLTTIGDNNTPLTNATWYYYNTDTTTTVAGKYWYYDGVGNIVTFTK